VSPMKIEAGGALNQRKPSPAPITRRTGSQARRCPTRSAVAGSR
jgi:hypothetical protein